MDQANTLLRAISGKSKVTILPGTFVSATLTTFQVDVGGGRIPAAPLTSYLPEINESVWVVFIDGVPYVAGPTVGKAGQGVVTAVSGGLVTMTTAFGTVVAPYPASLTPTVSQTLKIIWQGGPFAVGVMSAVPASGVAPPAPTTGTTTHTDTFTAIDGGTYQSGRWWTTQVYASSSTLGAFFYGSKISDTIPAGATVQAIQFYVSPAQISGASPNFALHAYLSKPGGSPTLTSSTAVAIAPGWVTIPTGFGTALKAGGGSFGVGFNHGGFNIFNSLAADGLSGALKITSVY